MKTETQVGMLVRVIVLLLGLLGLLLGYYWVHKPFDLALGVRLGGAILDVLTVIALFVIAGGIGRFLLSRLPLESLSRAERVALEGLVGLGSISIGVLLLGLIGLYTPLVIWPVLGVIALLLRQRVGGWLGDWRGLIAELRFSNGWQTVYTVLSVILLTLALFRALTPPHAWDAMTYHLVGPERYLAAGRIATQPDNHFLGFPQLAELLYGVVVGLFGRDSTAALVHYGFGLLGMIAAAGIARRHASYAAGWLAILLLVSAYSVWMLMGWPYVDLAAMAYGAAALVAASHWRETRTMGGLILLGVLAGLAFGVKYTTIGLGITLAVYILWHSRSLRALVVFGVAALITFAPWLLKGLLLYGNPVYPFLFNGVSWDAQRAATFSTFGSGLLSSEVWQIPILPLAATVFGVEKGPGYAFTAGPWLLTAPLLLILVWRWLEPRARRLVLDCALIGLPLLVYWMLLAATSEIGMQTRLIAMALPISAVAGAIAFDGLRFWPEKPVQVSFIARVLLVATLILSTLEAVNTAVTERAVPYVLGYIETDPYLDETMQAHAGAMRALNDLPVGSVVRLMWEPRSYYCPPTVICHPDILLDHWSYPLKKGQLPEQIFAAWRDAGENYLLVWHAGYETALNDPRAAAENARFEAAREQYLTPVWTDGFRYTLYTWGEALESR